jgi:DNA-binding transcriptional LysR family regulator
MLDEMNVEVLFDDDVVIAAGVESPWARRRKIDLADLAGAPWILTEGNTWNKAIIAAAFAAHALEMPKVCLMTLSVHLRTNLLATGKFVTVLPRSVVALYGRRFSLKVLPVAFPTRPWPVAAVTLKSRTPSPVVELFIEHLRTFSKTLPGRL